MRPPKFFKQLAVFLAGVIVLGWLIVHSGKSGISQTVKAESIHNDIILCVDKLDDMTYHLQWADTQLPLPNPAVYRVYRTTNPTVLGDKIATVPGNEYIDSVASPDVPAVYFYQVVRVNE